MRSTATILTSITGRSFKVTPNHSAKTFTIVTNGTKYRTVRLSKAEFKSCLNNTGNDWANFLNSDDYYRVR